MAAVKQKKREKITRALIILSLLAFSAFLFFLAYGPGIFGLTGPQTPSTYEQQEQALFVYGSLRYALVRRLVFGGSGRPKAALLPGYRRRGLDIVADDRAEVPGLLLTVDPRQLAALDRYERVGRRYDRVRVELADGSRAWVYRRR